MSLAEEKSMWRMLLILILLCSTSLIVSAQSWTFTRDGIDYEIDFPSATWRPVSQVDVHQHVNFINDNNEANGYLRLTKILVDAGTTAADIFRREEKWELQKLPGYMACGECTGESFQGHLSGSVFSYEYVSAGKQVTGRVYYLQLDKRTYYALRFTFSRDHLQTVSQQADHIARSFRMK